MSEQESLDGKNFVGIGLALGDSGTFGMVQLYNPASSTKLLVVRRIVIIGTYPAPTAFDIRKLNTQLGTPLTPSRGANKRINISVPPVAQISTYASTVIPATPPIHELWVGASSQDHTYDFTDDPFIIDPGWSLFTASMSSGGYNITTWHWKESDIV